MKVLSFLFARYGFTKASKKALSLRERKKFSSWQANSPYFARLSSSLSRGHCSTKANFARSSSLPSVVKSEYTLPSVS